MEIILYYKSLDISKNVVITELYKLKEFFNDKKYIPIFNNEEVDLLYSFEYYSIKSGDIIILCKKKDCNYDNAFIKGHVGNNFFRILIDCTISENIISASMIKKFDLQYKIKSSNDVKDVAIRLGSKGILKFIDFNVCETETDVIIFGLQFLYCHGVVFDIGKKRLKIDNIVIKFLENDIVEEYKEIYNMLIDKIEIKYNFKKMLEKIGNNSTIVYGMKLLFKNTVLGLGDKVKSGNIVKMKTTNDYYYKLIFNSIPCAKFLRTYGFIVSATYYSNVISYYNIIFMGLVDIVIFMLALITEIV